MPAHADDAHAEQSNVAPEPTRRSRRRPPSRLRRALSLGTRILGWSVAALCVVLIVAFVVVPASPARRRTLC